MEICEKHGSEVHNFAGVQVILCQFQCNCLLTVGCAKVFSVLFHFVVMRGLAAGVTFLKQAGW